MTGCWRRWRLRLLLIDLRPTPKDPTGGSFESPLIVLVTYFYPHSFVSHPSPHSSSPARPGLLLTETVSPDTHENLLMWWRRLHKNAFVICASTNSENSIDGKVSFESSVFSYNFLWCLYVSGFMSDVFRDLVSKGLKKPWSFTKRPSVKKVSEFPHPHRNPAKFVYCK